MQGLYLVTPDWDDTAALLAYTDAALGAGATLLQYRHKTAGDAQRREQAAALLALCRRHGVPFIVNDHVPLACDIGADGVHVGGTDVSVAEARALVGPERIVGASCYGQLQLAIDAASAGASYVAFGGFYPSRVKRYEVTTPHAILADARSQVALPRVVIGGMTPANAAPLVAQGADMVAAISSVYGAADPAGAAAAVREFVRLFAQG
jgi:thiamine-phosphate pyrophosphorylase